MFTLSNKWLSLVIENFGLTFFLLSILIALLDWPLQRYRRNATMAEIFFRWIVLLPVGLTCLFGFILHAFFIDMTATIPGWTINPLQFGVAMAYLGFGMMAIFAFNADYGYRLATVIGITFWFWGNAISCAYYQTPIDRMPSLLAVNSWFWLDILIPFILGFCLWKLKPEVNITPTQYVKPEQAAS